MKKSRTQQKKEYIDQCSKSHEDHMKELMTRPIWAPSFRETFIPIDRKEEDSDVVLFQKTKDMAVLEKLYHNRIQTLKIWSSRNYYLDDSSDDMFAELSRVFVKAVHKYENRRACKQGRKTVYRHTPFNTYLYSALFNHVKNKYSSKKAKKRLPEGQDYNVVLSLDYNYGSNEDTLTLKDIVSNEHSVDKESHTEKVYFDETMDILTHKEPELIRDFFVKLSQGGTINQLLREHRTKRGRIRITKTMANKLSKGRRCPRIVADLIAEKSRRIKGDFTLIDYHVKKPNTLWFTVEMDRTPESDAISKKLRHLRRNKNAFISKIRGLGKEIAIA